MVHFSSAKPQRYSPPCRYILTPPFTGFSAAWLVLFRCPNVEVAHLLRRLAVVDFDSFAVQDLQDGGMFRFFWWANISASMPSSRAYAPSSRTASANCHNACTTSYVGPVSIGIGPARRMVAATSVLAHSWMNCDVLMQAPVEALGPIGVKDAVNEMTAIRLDNMS